MQYAVKRSGNAVGYCALSIKCGTTGGGIAHFVEHTLFKGTKHKSASVINACLDKLGGELNAYTTKEEIVLQATVLKEDVGRAAALLFELATCPTFPENEIKVEKGVVIDEINSYKDAPAEEIYDRFEEMLFSGHPLACPVLGTAASVRKLTPKQLLAFVKEKFIPANMAFTVVADLPEKKMEALAKKLNAKYLAAFGEAESDACRFCGQPFAASAPFHEVKKTRNHQLNCVIGGLAPSLYDEDDRIATVLLCNILGGPATNSILNLLLREKYGWVYNIECSYGQYSDAGVVAICLGCDKENIDACLKVISRELEKLQRVPMSERKLKAAKKQLLGQLAISGDNGEAQCLSMGKSLMAYGRVSSAEENRARIEAVSAAQLRRLACTLFAPDRLSTLVFA